MRNRQKSYKDYGITKEEVKYIKDFCRQSTEEEKEIIKSALSEVQEYIAPYIYRSLVENLSYEDLCAKEYIFMCKDDFYARRRQGMECIKRWMILNNLWKM